MKVYSVKLLKIYIYIYIFDKTEKLGKCLYKMNLKSTITQYDKYTKYIIFFFI